MGGKVCLLFIYLSIYFNSPDIAFSELQSSLWGNRKGGKEGGGGRGTDLLVETLGGPN